MMKKLLILGISGLFLMTATSCRTFTNAMDAIGIINKRVDLDTFGADFDDLCIAGKFRDDAAEWMNANQESWKQHGDYTDGRQPSPVKSGDRLFNGDCSEFTKRLIAGDFDGAIDALGLVGDGGTP